MPTAAEIVREIVSEHRDDIDRSIALSIKAVRKHPELLEEIIDYGIRETVYAVRGMMNAEFRASRETPMPTGKAIAGAAREVPAAKVVVGTSADVQAAYQSVYDLFIAGKTLGTLTGEDLPNVVAHERGKANAHTFNVRLLEALVPLVPEKKRVKDCVPEKKLRAIYERVWNDSQGWG